MFKNISKVLAVSSLLSAFSLVHAMPTDTRITLPSGKKIFVSGMNLAWKNFANDVGDADLEETYFKKAFKDVADSGGNCMRVWLSTDGTHDPKYGTDGLVSGPGSKTIVNIQKMLKIAKDNKILLMPVLLTHNLMELKLNSTIRANNKKLLQTEAGLQAYIDKYLVPVVIAIGNDPNLICWEIFNEAEGMVTPWKNLEAGITKQHVQRANNRIAAAIKTAVPGVLVSTGTVTTGELSWYSDAALIAEGGKANGTLDFYMAHYYGWNGVSNSPFTKSYASWSKDKPLVIGEYASSSWDQNNKQSSSPLQDAANVDTLLTYLNKAGYAGGLGWQYQQDGGDPWMKGFSTFAHSMMEVYRADSNSIKLDGVASNTFAVMVSAGSGGTVTTSLKGRIEAGKTDTLTATATAGYSFSGWSGDTTATAPVLVIKNITKDWVIQANFTPAAGTNLLKGGDFIDNTPWGFYAAEGNTAEVKYTAEQAVISFTKSDSLNYHIQFTQGGIKIDSGVTYVISFEATSTGERPIYVGMSTEGTWHFQGGSDVMIGATKKVYQVEITPDSSTTAGILQFNLGGGSLLSVTIDNVAMVKKAVAGVAPHNKVLDATIHISRAGDAIHWNAPSRNATASLLDLSGRMIRSVNRGEALKLNGVPEGVYICAISSGLSCQRFKLVR